MRYIRNMQGYGANPPAADWPGGANVAVQFVLNYEEGGENCILHGDEASEAFLSDIPGAQPWPGMRHWGMEFDLRVRRPRRLLAESTACSPRPACPSPSTASPPRWPARPPRSPPCRRPAGRSPATA